MEATTTSTSTPEHVSFEDTLSAAARDELGIDRPIPVDDYDERFEARPVDLSHAPFFTDQLEVRRRDSEEFYRGLERNGPRAVAEFARAAGRLPEGSRPESASSRARR